jgi:hypothetical protein
MVILIFKVFTARRLYKSFGVKWLIKLPVICGMLSRSADILLFVNLKKYWLIALDSSITTSRIVGYSAKYSGQPELFAMHRRSNF